MIMEPEINRAWPDSMPLMPARMLMALVQNTASIPIQTQQRIPTGDHKGKHIICQTTSRKTTSFCQHQEKKLAGIKFKWCNLHFGTCIKKKCNYCYENSNTKSTTQLTQIQVQPKQHSERLWHDNDCIAKVGEIDHKQWQGSDGGKQQLVSPPQVQHVVGKTQEDHAADGQESPDQLHKLRVRNSRWVQ